jgi:hypothetical protein
LPIPPIIEIGQAADSWYALSPRAPGVNLKWMADGDRRRLVLRVIETLRRLGAVEAPAGGYGHWNESGVGTSTDWWGFLRSINTPERVRRLDGSL